MKLLTLNIRGLGSGEKIGELKQLLRKESVEILALQETILAEEICLGLKNLWAHSELGYAKQLAHERSGGLLFFWNKQMWDL